jgi:hypothetical protein
MINFVTEPTPYWILGKWCEEFTKHIPDSTITAMYPDPRADVNVFVNYALYRKTSGLGLSVFTHREHDPYHGGIFDQMAEQSDWCFAQCENTLKLLPKDKSSTLPIGISPHFFKESIVIGVAGRGYASGRKRYDWLKELDIQGIEIKRAEDTPHLDMPSFYDSIDYLLITSDNEGGPAPVKEALARGKMVISTRVGWATDFPIILYDTLDELKDILTRLVIPQDEFEQGAKHIIEVVNKLWYK